MQKQVHGIEILNRKQVLQFKKRMLTKKALVILLIGISLTSCLDDPISARKITKDYYLQWVSGKNHQMLLKSSDKGKSGNVIIPETVFAVGFNENYIIAKQHPNIQDQINSRLFGERVENGDYLLKNPNDTIYLWKEDHFYEENGKWYHTSNGWNPPDSLKFYKKITYYHIIDIISKNGEDFKFDNESEFWKKREDLGISKKLNFSITDKELE